MDESTREYILDRVSKRHAVPGFTECWEWQLVPSANGYGLTNRVLKREHAHRVSFREFKGTIPTGWQVDHLCFNRICVNPDHLEAVAPTTNVGRAAVRAGSPGYALFQTADGRWRTVVRRDGQQKRFTSVDRDRAIAKMQRFLATN